MSVETANMVADKIVSLNKEYNSRLVSKDLQILRPYLQAMETMAVLRTVNKESQPFALALVLGSIGIFKSSSEIGLIGPGLEAIVRYMSKGLEIIDPNHPVGDKKLMVDGATFILGAMMTLAAWGATEGTAISLYDEDAQKEINSFSLELLLLMGLESSLPEYIIDTVTEAANYTGSKQRDIANATALITTLLTIWTISTEKGPKLENVVENAKPRIARYIKQLESSIERYYEQSKDPSNALLIWIKQARFAIDSGDTDKLIGTINDALKICGTTPEQLQEDIQDICIQTKTILGLLRHGGDEDLNTVTGIWQTG